MIKIYVNKLVLGLFSLFNGKSNFMGYLMPKLSL